MAGQMGKMSQKNAQNEALAEDYENRKTNYVNNLAIDYARYQNEKIDYQVNSDIIFRQFVAKYFGDQTRINQLQAVDLRSQEQALTALAKKALCWSFDWCNWCSSCCTTIACCGSSPFCTGSTAN